MRALEKPEVALGAIYARVCVRARIRSSTFTDNSRAFTTATRADLVVSCGAKDDVQAAVRVHNLGHLAHRERVGAVLRRDVGRRSESGRRRGGYESSRRDERVEGREAMRTGIASARCVVVDSCVSNGSLASGGDLPSRSSRWGRSSGGFRAWGRTSNAFCIFPLPKKPRSPPCFADEQSDTFAARSAKETAPDSICSLYAMSSSSAASLVFFGMCCPSGSRQDAGRRLPWCLTRRCEARTSSADMAALGWSEDAVVGRRVLRGARATRTGVVSAQRVDVNFFHFHARAMMDAMMGHDDPLSRDCPGASRRLDSTRGYPPNVRVSSIAVVSRRLAMEQPFTRRGRFARDSNVSGAISST